MKNPDAVNKKNWYIWLYKNIHFYGLKNQCMQSKKQMRNEKLGNLSILYITDKKLISLLYKALLKGGDEDHRLVEIWAKDMTT